MPSAEAIVAMVNEGWGFEALMAMPASEFGFWLESQGAHSKRQVEASKAGNK